jgi:hypothetical protein
MKDHGPRRQCQSSKCKLPSFTLRLWWQVVSLRTLSQGTVEVVVQDGQCDLCSQLFPWDRHEIAIFRADKTTGYTQEFLQHWLHSVAGRVQTIIATYDVWVGVDRAESTAHAVGPVGMWYGGNAAESDLNPRVGRALRRKAASDAICNYVKLLDAPPGNVLHKLFDCVACKNEYVVFDGTSMGTLNPLYLSDVADVEVDAPANQIVSKTMYLSDRSRVRTCMQELIQQARSCRSSSSEIMSCRCSHCAETLPSRRATS